MNDFERNFLVRDDAVQDRFLAASFEFEMRAGWDALEHVDIASAEVHFHRAHALGHEDTPKHLRSHLGLLSVFLRRLDFQEIAKQIASIVVLFGIFCFKWLIRKFSA